MFDTLSVLARSLVALGALGVCALFAGCPTDAPPSSLVNSDDVRTAETDTESTPDPLAPVIESVSPRIAPGRSYVLVEGHNFGKSTGDVFIGAVPVESVQEWNDDRIVIYVSDRSSGLLRVQTGGRWSNGVSLTIIEALGNLDSAGGNLAVSNEESELSGASIQVPVGALSAPTLFWIARSAVLPQLPSGVRRVGPPLRLGPHGLQLAGEPVTVRTPLDRTLTEEEAATVGVAHPNIETLEWEVIQPLRVEADALVFETGHFSDFFAVDPGSLGFLAGKTVTPDALCITVSDTFDFEDQTLGYPDPPDGEQPQPFVNECCDEDVVCINGHEVPILTPNAAKCSLGEGGCGCVIFVCISCQCEFPSLDDSICTSGHDDGVACTDEICVGGTKCCDHPPNDDLCVDAVDCTEDWCDPVQDCQHEPNEALCVDAVDCTEDWCDPAVGCQHEPNDGLCDDGIECTADECDPLSGCLHIPDDSACDDDCSCTTDWCSSVHGCVHEPENPTCQAADELCDEKDNNCDGDTDEDWPDKGQPCDGPDADVAKNGIWECKDDGSGLRCVESGPELCNGIDDDGDGQTDEDWPDKGQPCCAVGTWECAEDGTGLECVTEEGTNHPPAAEIFQHESFPAVETCDWPCGAGACDACGFALTRLSIFPPAGEPVPGYVPDEDLAEGQQLQVTWTASSGEFMLFGGGSSDFFSSLQLTVQGDPSVPEEMEEDGKVVHKHDIVQVPSCGSGNIVESFTVYLEACDSCGECSQDSKVVSASCKVYY